MSNLITAHRWCNTVRGDTPVDTARAALAGCTPPESWQLDRYRATAARITTRLRDPQLINTA